MLCVGVTGGSSGLALVTAAALGVSASDAFDAGDDLVAAVAAKTPQGLAPTTPMRFVSGRLDCSEPSKLFANAQRFSCFASQATATPSESALYGLGERNNLVSAIATESPESAPAAARYLVASGLDGGKPVKFLAGLKMPRVGFGSLGHGSLHRLRLGPRRRSNAFGGR